MPQVVTHTITDPAETQVIWKTVYNNSTDLTVGIGGVLILADAPVGSVTINLPAAASNKDRLLVVKVIEATNNVIVDPSGSETIDGSTTKTLTTLGEVLRIVCDGDEWHEV